MPSLKSEEILQVTLEGMEEESRVASIPPPLVSSVNPVSEEEKEFSQ